MTETDSVVGGLTYRHGLQVADIQRARHASQEAVGLKVISASETITKCNLSQDPNDIDNPIANLTQPGARKCQRHEENKAKAALITKKKETPATNTHVQNPGFATGPSAIVVSISKMTPAAPPCMTPL